jgi:hypothetical protein
MQQPFLLLFLIPLSFSLKFGFEIKPYATFCTGEYLTENTVAIFSISSSSNKLNIELFSPDSKKIYEKKQQGETKVSFTSSSTGNYKLCVKSYDNNVMDIDIDFASGVAAKDYSELAKQSNLKPLELSLQRLEDMLTFTMRDISNVAEFYEHHLSDNQSLHTKTLAFSLITMIVMVTTGIMETVYIQRYLHQKKVI